LAVNRVEQGCHDRLHCLISGDPKPPLFPECFAGRLKWFHGRWGESYRRGEGGRLLRGRPPVRLGAGQPNYRSSAHRRGGPPGLSYTIPSLEFCRSGLRPGLKWFHGTRGESACALAPFALRARSVCTLPVPCCKNAARVNVCDFPAAALTAHGRRVVGQFVAGFRAGKGPAPGAYSDNRR
jgi:hypothetical protein